ncbi:ABC transporter ATP-binding protein [Candidatus Woesearchaeota archaeon]|nr:ABC transporter ATP-binding protein [Candidatus Woesearchaeota archaeon]
MANKNTRKEEEFSIDYKYNLKLYWSILRRYKPLIVSILAIILVLESAHTFDRYLFKIIVDKGTTFIAGTITREAYLHVLLLIGAVFLVSIVTKASLRWFYFHCVNKMEVNIMLDIKTKFLHHLVGLSYNFHTTHKTGSLISKLIRSGSAVERMTDTFVFNFFPLAFQLVVITASIVYFDVTSAAIIILIAASFIGYSILMAKKMQSANVEANEAEDSEKAHISDIFTNIESIKYFGKEKAIQEKYKPIGEQTRDLLLHYWSYFRWQSAGLNLILGIGTLLIVYFPLVKILNGEMSIGTLVFIYTVYGGLLNNLFSFDHGIRGFYRSMADFESLFKYYKIENDIKDKPGSGDLQVKRGEIEFKDVSFSYKNRPIFNKFNLVIPKNKKVALIGPSGGGKTSLIRLLYRLYDVDEGKITIDGKNIDSFRQESLRSEFSVVPQECVLFDDTVYNNIAFSRPGATRKEVMQAMRFAQLDRIVKKFPKQENTIVGERGVKLSGGEKQRVSIARAILADKKVLVLDEATSSLDSETESEIQKDLYRLMQGRTSIIIAHRLSTVMHADMIVVIDKGKITQTGNHKDLIRKEGIYKKLWNLQKGGYLE